MLPMGGPKVWGNATWAPDDVASRQLTAVGRTLGGIIARVQTREEGLGEAVRANSTGSLSAEQVELLRSTVGGWRGLERPSPSSSSSLSSSLSSSAAAGEQSEQSEQQPKPQRGEALDVNAALKALAATAGLQFSLNMERWAAATKRLDLSVILEQHRRVEAAVAAAAVEREEARRQRAATAASSGGGGGNEDGSGKQECRSTDAAADAENPADAVGATAALRRQRQQQTARGGASKPAVNRPQVPLFDLTKSPLPVAPKLKLYCL